MTHKPFPFTKDCKNIIRIAAISIAALILYSSCNLKEVTVKDESGNISKCTIYDLKTGQTFRGGRNHTYTIQ